MKAVICHASNEALVLEERPCPAPGPGEVLVRIERCGICGSELHMPHGATRSFPGGLIMGHEYAGRIAAIGPQVEGLAEGDAVALYPALGCGNCPACDSGNEILCASARRLLGGWAEYAVIPQRATIKLPAGLTAADGALVEPLAVSFYGVKVAGSVRGKRVLVLGAGSIALGAIFWARREGAARIVAMSRSSSRASLALEMGADAFVAYGESEMAEVAAELGGAADIVLECVGAPGMLDKAIAHAALFGRVISLGLCPQPDSIAVMKAGMKDITIRFPVGYTRDDFREVAQTMRDGHVDPGRMISRVIGLADLPETYARMVAGSQETKVQIAP